MDRCRGQREGPCATRKAPPGAPAGRRRLSKPPSQAAPMWHDSTGGVGALEAAPGPQMARFYENKSPPGGQSTTLGPSLLDNAQVPTCPGVGLPSLPAEAAPPSSGLRRPGPRAWSPAQPLVVLPATIPEPLASQDAGTAFPRHRARAGSEGGRRPAGCRAHGRGSDEDRAGDQDPERAGWPHQPLPSDPRGSSCLHPSGLGRVRGPPPQGLTGRVPLNSVTVAPGPGGLSPEGSGQEMSREGVTGLSRLIGRSAGGGGLLALKGTGDTCGSGPWAPCATCGL